MNKYKAHDIHQEITDNIIQLLDQVDEKNYQPPFASLANQGLPENPTTDQTYRGVNILALWFNQQAKQFTSNKWATFKQWQEQGVQVKKGAKGSRVIFYKTLTCDEENDQGEKEEKQIPMMKLYTVFNANQVEGFEDTDAIKLPEFDHVTKINLIDEFCRNTGAEIRQDQDQAYYVPSKDFINMPLTSSFLETSQITATEHYYSTLLHELTHWTGATHRLDRLGISSSNVTKAEYAFEELIAELGSAFLCSKFNIAQSHTENHAIYIKSWLNQLKNDKTYIFKAATQASKAAEYLNSLHTTRSNCSWPLNWKK